MIHLRENLTPADLMPGIRRLWELSAGKIESIEATRGADDPAPVFTWEGKYTAQGWTEWTEGFQYGSSVLQFDATGDQKFLDLAKGRTLNRMASHVSHTGVHDHGFNNISTYGNLWRLMREGAIAQNDWEQAFYELALKASGAVQGARWTPIADGTGFIHSFNGPQSLFIDTIRSCRSLSLAHQLGHVLMGEQDAKISLLQRAMEHARNTGRFNVWYGEGRDIYDLRGRTSHESIFNVKSGEYRCPSTQQGYSPYTTWTRGLAWAIAGYPEQLEFLRTRPDDDFMFLGGRDAVVADLLKAAQAVCDFYIEHTPTCGVPYWDTGAPGLARMGDYLDKPADPYNAHEPVDSSAAAIAAQGLIRFGHYLGHDSDAGERYLRAGLTVLSTILEEPYLSTDPDHQGLILHSQYHRPNGWDRVPEGQQVPNGEATMWGDYHAREAAIYVQRLAEGRPYYAFFGAGK